jgi:hypothetical protein
LTDSRGPKQARKTVALVSGAFALIAAWNLYRGRMAIAEGLGSIAGILLGVGLAPAASLRFHRGWMRLAETLGYVNSRIILTLLFVLVITPTGLIMKLLRRDPLLRRGPNRDDYWITRERTRQPVESFERTF